MWNSKHNTYGLTYPLDANLGDSSSFFANSLIANGLLCGEDEICPPAAATSRGVREQSNAIGEPVAPFALARIRP